jgi:uncharacterized protein (TIGR03437 family)
MNSSRARFVGVIALVLACNADLQAQRSERVQTLASQIEVLNRELTASAKSSTDRLNILLAERSAALLSLAQLDALRALSLMFQGDEADRLRSRGAAVESEGEWEGTAGVVVEDDFSHRTARWIVTLDLNGDRAPVYLTNTQPSFRSGDIIRIRGKQLGSAIIAEDKNVALVSASTGCPTVGELQVAAFLVNMPGQSLPPQVTSSFADQLIFSSSPPSLNSYLSEASYGRTSAAGQVFPYTLPQAYDASQDRTDLFNALIDAADAAVDFRKYNRIVVIRNSPPDAIADYATIGCLAYNSPSHGPFQASVSWLHYGESAFADQSFPETSQGLYELAHEFGHELGLMHANTIQFGGQPLGVSANAGTDAEYGDWFATMGQFQGDYRLPSGLWVMITPQYDAPHKNQLGWFAANELQNVKSPGTFVLQPFEATTGSNPKALRVLRSVGGADQYLWVEYRQPLGYDANWNWSTRGYPLIQPYVGALIHFEDPNTSASFIAHSHLLDFTAAATPGDFRDAALTPGMTWNDPYSALSLTVNSATTSSLIITVRYDSTTPPPVPSITSLNPSSATAAGAAFTLTVNGTAFLFGATLQWNGTTLPATFVGATQLTASVPANLIASTGAASISVVNPGGASSNTVTLPIIAPVPIIAKGGIGPVNSASATIQPGEWVSIYGTNLASGTTTWTGDFPTSLGGTRVTINNKPAYLSFVNPGQINLQAPDDMASGAVPVVVTTAGGSAASFVTLAQFAPSFFLLDAKHVAGIILRSNGSGAYGGGAYDIIGPTGTQLGYSTVAARAGDIIELFGTGFGPTNPVVLSGQAFSGAAPTINPVQLFMNNVSVTPSFAGLSGAGLYQFNVTVPSGLGTGDVSLRATVGGVQTPSGVVISLQ